MNLKTDCVIHISTNEFGQIKRNKKDVMTETHTNLPVVKTYSFEILECTDVTPA